MSGTDLANLVLGLLLVTVTVTANLGLTMRWARLVTFAVLAGLAVFTLLVAALVGLPVPLTGLRRQPGLGLGLAISAVMLLASLDWRFRRAAAKLVPIDPDNVVHATALGLSLYLVGVQAATQLNTDVLSAVAQSAPLTVPSLLSQQLPILLVALAGVGLFVRRSPAQAAARLGIVRPELWQVVFALLLAGLFVAFSLGMDQLGSRLQPGVADRLNQANQHLFSGLAGPAGLATIALGAGIAEETLFRGAIQPRFGIVWTSVLFASVHTQYGLTYAVVTVFVLGACLGLVRKHLNTTTGMICHAAYNATIGLTGGIELARLAPALIGVELLLVGLLGWRLISGGWRPGPERRSAGSGPPSGSPGRR